MLVHFFGILWTHAWFLGMTNLTIAGATADWFLTEDKTTMKLPAFASAHRTLRYHAGTAAVGAFIIAVVQFIRWVFRYFMYQLNKMNPDSSLVKALSCIGECCLDCLERFLDFINKNAYIQCAINATGFYTSAYAAAQLLARNILRVGTLNIISSIFIFVGKYFVALATGIIAALWMAALDNGGTLDAGMENVTSAPVFPVIVVVCIAFGVACGFPDVWDMVIDTIFQCYCMDEEYGTNKAPGEMKTTVADNAPSDEDIKSLNAVTRKAKA